MLSRDEIVLEYLERLPYPPYPVQEEAMFAWAACEQGILLSAPTGTGKTLVAEAAVYEGLLTGKSRLLLDAADRPDGSETAGTAGYRGALGL